MPLPTAGLLKFRYADSDFNMSTSVGGGYFTYNVFSGNSPFDPDVTGGGVQPYGWDPYSAVFNIYNCVGSKIRVRFYTAESPVYKAVCTVAPAITNALGYQDPNDMRMTNKARQHIISSAEGITRSHFISSYASTRSIYPSYSPKDGSFSTLWTASPTSRWYWHVYVDTSDQATEDTIYMDVQITYYCWCLKNQNNNES